MPPTLCCEITLVSNSDFCVLSIRFEFHFLPAIKHHKGKVALIGDNLASHITIRVLELCSQRGVIFICLPANSTHICQPLDVAVYRPLKIYWRRILNEGKESDEGRKTEVIPKPMFPALLKRRRWKRTWFRVSENTELYQSARMNSWAGSPLIFPAVQTIHQTSKIMACQHCVRYQITWSIVTLLLYTPTQLLYDGYLIQI